MYIPTFVIAIVGLVVAIVALVLSLDLFVDKPDHEPHSLSVVNVVSGSEQSASKMGTDNPIGGQVLKKHEHFGLVKPNGDMVAYRVTGKASSEKVDLTKYSSIHVTKGPEEEPIVARVDKSSTEHVVKTGIFDDIPTQGFFPPSRGDLTQTPGFQWDLVRHNTLGLFRINIGAEMEITGKSSSTDNFVITFNEKASCYIVKNSDGLFDVSYRYDEVKKRDRSLMSGLLSEAEFDADDGKLVRTKILGPNANAAFKLKLGIVNEDWVWYSGTQTLPDGGNTKNKFQLKVELTDVVGKAVTFKEASDAGVTGFSINFRKSSTFVEI